jgi:hypothetical protein
MFEKYARVQCMMLGILTALSKVLGSLTYARTFLKNILHSFSGKKENKT